MQATTLAQEKRYLLLCLLALALALSLTQGEALLILALGELALLYRKREDRKRLTLRLLTLGGLLLLSLLPLAWGQGAEGDLLLRYGTWGFSYSGLALAGQTFLRASAALLATLLLLAYLPLYRLYSVLRSMGVPKLFIELVELTYRYIFLLEETAGQIRLAQTSRLGYQGGGRRKLEHFAMLLARTFILSQTESDRLYLGLVSRGYEDDYSHIMSDSANDTEEKAPSHPLLQAHALSFYYAKEKPALQEIELTIKAGERIALLGHNGAGKSTLFLLLAGLQDTWQGEVYLHGSLLQPSQRSQLRRHVALVLQNSNYQLFTPSVEDEIAFGLKNIGLQGDALQERLEHLLTTYELQDLRHTPPHQLSEGQKKWVALIAVLATEPAIILLDEPTAALDQRYTRRVLSLLEELNQQGKTIILSTHDMELASLFAERVVLLEAGQIKADRPASAFWADTLLLAEAELKPPYRWQGSEDPLPSNYPTAITHLTRKYHLPLFLAEELLPLLFIGGGRGIWRKAQGLLERQIPFSVLSETLCPELKHYWEMGAFTWRQARYTGTEDLSPARILIAGIGDAQLEALYAEQWEHQGFLFAILSDPSRGNIQFGATSHQAGLTVALHSDYRLPEVTSQLRDSWLQGLPPDFEHQLAQLATLRQDYLSAEGERRLHLQAIYQQQKELILRDLRS